MPASNCPDSFFTIQVDDKTGSAIYTLRQTYQKHLLPYESYSQQRMDPGSTGKGKGKRSAATSTPSRFDAMLAAVDDAAEAAEILGNLMTLERPATGDTPPLKRHRSSQVRLRSLFPKIEALLHVPEQGPQFHI